MDWTFDDALHDAERMAWLLATMDSARLIDEELHGAAIFKGKQPKARHDVEGRDELLRFALHTALDPARAPSLSPAGLLLEFGVHKGETVTHLAQVLEELRTASPQARAALPAGLHGFDSFEGLPDDWFLGRKAGRFSLDGKLPQVPESVRLHKGWFDASLPTFLTSHPGPALFVHADADLYSSTVTILDNLTRAGRIVAGTVIVFDEFFNYPGWRHHEYRAFKEWVAREHINFDYIGMAPCHYSVAVRIK